MASCRLSDTVGYAPLERLVSDYAPAVLIRPTTDEIAGIRVGRISANGA